MPKILGTFARRSGKPYRRTFMRLVRGFAYFCGESATGRGGLQAVMPAMKAIRVMMVLQCAILFGCLALGELFIYLTGIPLPGSIVGMLLLTLFLKLKWIRLEWIKGLSDFLISNMGFFFVPAGVGLMLCLDIVKAGFWPIVVSTVASTVLVLAVTGWSHQFLRKNLKSPRKGHGISGK